MKLAKMKLSKRDLYALGALLGVMMLAYLKSRLLDLTPEEHEEVRKTLTVGAALLAVAFWGTRLLGGPLNLAITVGIMLAGYAGALGLTGRLLQPARVRCGPGCGYDPVSDYCLCLGRIG